MPAEVLTVSPFVLPAGVTWDQALVRLARGAEVETAPAECLRACLPHRLRVPRRRGIRALPESAMTYVAPVPGGDERRALVFQYTVLSVDDENAAELAKGLLFVGAAIMSTLRWVDAR